MEDMGQAACRTILTEGAEAVVVERAAEGTVAVAEAELEEEEEGLAEVQDLEPSRRIRCHRLGCSIQRLWRVRPTIATIAMAHLAITVREAGIVIMRALRAVIVLMRVWRGVSGGLASVVHGMVRIVGAVVMEEEVVIMGVESLGERIL